MRAPSEVDLAISGCPFGDDVGVTAPVPSKVANFAVSLLHPASHNAKERDDATVQSCVGSIMHEHAT